MTKSRYLSRSQLWQAAVARGLFSRETAVGLDRAFRASLSEATQPTSEQLLAWLVATRNLAPEQAEALARLQARVAAEVAFPSPPPPSPVPIAEENAVSSPVNVVKAGDTGLTDGGLPSIEIRAAETAARKQRRSSSSSRAPSILYATAGLGIALAVLGGVLVWLSRKPAEPLRSPLPPAAAVAIAVPPAAAVLTAADDAMWQAPTSGAPLDLAGHPPGAVAVLAIRYAELRADPQGRQWLEGSGTLGKMLTEEWPRLLGVIAEDVEQWVATAYVRGDEPLAWCWSARLTHAVLPEALAQRHPRAEQRVVAGQTILLSEGKAIWAAPQAQPPGVIAWPESELAGLSDLVGAASDAADIVRADLAPLAQRADGGRHVTLLASPSLFDERAADLLGSDYAGWAGDLRELIGDDARGFLLSLHQAAACCVELQVLHGGGAQQASVALERRWSQLSTTTAARLASKPPGAYAEPLVSRLPAMLDALARYTRRELVDEVTVLRAYLPAAAGANLAWALRLAAAEQRPAAPVGETAATVPAREGSPSDPAVDSLEGVAVRLERQVSLEFPRQPLVSALELLAAELKVPVEIDNAALAAEGITRNQSIALSLQDVAAGEVLAAILTQASPEGKLTYRVRRLPAADRWGVWITTLAGAESAVD